MAPPRSAAIPREAWSTLFLRFLKFGLLAWGGPVAQIAMIRQELVEDERWISPEEFNRVLGVYQVLPGPEAHELCVYFGMRSRGRLGGFLAGLGFMLPGFVLMFLLSGLYVSGTRSPYLQAFFLGLQPAVVALIIRAVHRIGQHALTARALWGIAIASAAAQFAGTSFWVTLPLAGLLSLGIARRRRMVTALAAVLLLAGVVFSSGLRLAPGGATPPGAGAPAGESAAAPVSRLFMSGLRSGLLTFGGAYTVLPYLQHDAVVVGQWMTNEEFLDGVALSGTLPAPFIIFSTFVGYLGGGPIGALALTVAIFLPAFAFTLVGHQYLERLFANQPVQQFLDGVTAGVVGLIAVTAISLFRVGISDLPGAVAFSLALITLYVWKARAAVAVVMLVAGVWGLRHILPLVGH